MTTNTPRDDRAEIVDEISSLATPEQPVAEAQPVEDQQQAGERIAQLDRAHVFHSWSAQDQINPLPVAYAKGSTFTDYTGKDYLDFSSQLVYTNLGHQHPKLVAALKKQADKLATIAPAFANEARSELAARIAEVAPGNLNHVFFTNGGADANEYAIRMAKLYTGRDKVFSMYRSYHGSTGTAINITGDPRRWPNEQAGSGAVHFFGPYPYRSPFWSENDQEESARALEHLERQVILEGPQTIAAIIIETVVGTNGILVPPPGYLQGVRDMCDRYGICYIADEVMAGFGRTGTWFAVENFDVTPDLLTFAKGVNSGYVPLGGVAISEEIRNSFSQRTFPGGLTYSGHPLACAVGVESMKVFHEERILERTRELGESIVRPTLGSIKERHEVVGDIRGLGLFWGVELVRNKETKKPLVPFNAAEEDARPMLELTAACRELGLWPFTHFNRVHLTPPLTISESDLRRGLDLFDQALGTIAHYAE